MRPVLRPGSHVLRRDAHELQVGLDPHHAVVLPDDPDTRASLALLSRAAEEREYDERGTLRLLQTQELLLDASALMPLIPASMTDSGQSGPNPARMPRTPRHDVAAVARSAGDDVGTLLSARQGCRVEARTFADTSTGLLGGTLADLLRKSGVPVARSVVPAGRTSRDRAAGPATEAARPAARFDVAALVGLGEPARDLVDDWMRAGVPHLLVRLTEGNATVGPFVVPGETACLRCIDAHHTDADPSWPLLVAQYASLRGRDRGDGVPEPVDSLVAKLALAWAARDLASHAEARRPTTWSATIRFDPYLTSVETQTWLRHPDCGCAWG